MTVDYNDGKWHGWNGGERPVHPNSTIEVVYKNKQGQTKSDVRHAGDHWWDCSGLSGGYTIAFRVLEVYKEPKVIWVNEYPSGSSVVHWTEKEALRYGSQHAIRVAVKYQEVK